MEVPVERMRVIEMSVWEKMKKKKGKEKSEPAKERRWDSVKCVVGMGGTCGPKNI